MLTLQAGFAERNQVLSVLQEAGFLREQNLAANTPCKKGNGTPKRKPTQQTVPGRLLLFCGVGENDSC